MTKPETHCIHFFKHKIDDIPLPSAFTYPFHYTPHPLTCLAAEEVQEYLADRADWQEELRHGKMFGVLIVRTPDNRIGYLAAFSGNLAGSNHHSFFVPPVYDLLQPDGFFRIEEANISAINIRIREMEESEAYQSAIKDLQTTQADARSQLETAKRLMKEAKALREKRRAEGADETEQQAMIKESQFQKAEYKRLEKRLKEENALLEEKVSAFESRIDGLKQERKKRSARLQRQLFEQFRMLDANGEVKDLCEIFKDTPQGTPPAGAGECALPKLLQYAYLNGLRPLAMGEFWWGMSPKEEIRHHGYFYPSCKSKCEPILKHMLIGLEVEKNPLAEDIHRNTRLEIVYEDEWLVVVNKPAGMLSAPGKNDLDSVSQHLHRLYPDATGPMIVHRLDMATSGLILAAKDKDIHQRLQALFETREIKKRYTAILEGSVEEDEGIIRLPLCPDLSDRPRQIVNYEYGKPAVTLYRVVKRANGETLVSFFPQTGRTHQLRVHAAHTEGLHCPIKGDELYGKKADRLYLHAAELDFIHPVTGKKMHIVKESGFSL
ncbi:RluA family pseudouridine synthase [uncultured Bacteroides sp.]|uniref:RluA family pseudouridine synthase n=1 Tax=uncultured Bacteroides sp. TaxID=162156 RepID=UPI002639E252|nr:RluA family pseudouridine synthase [uncultured Bacteroides sp.]